MAIPSIQGVIRRAKTAFGIGPNGFLKRVSGVVHVGANVGQERQLYDRHGLRVIWIEPIPEVFRVLRENIKDYPHQVAFQRLVTDMDDDEHIFHISNNRGSSSIFPLKKHKELWPDVDYVEKITLKSTTLVSLFKNEGIDVSKYDALVMDTQGSEFLVLKGAADILRRFRYIKTEVADFEAYEGCCQVEDISAYLKDYGFREISRNRFAGKEGVGSYYDIVYKRKAGP